MAAPIIIIINYGLKGGATTCLKYDKNNVDNIRLRVPKGWNDRMKQHVAEQKLTDGTPKYNSVNDMLVQLIRKEIGIDE